MYIKCSSVTRTKCRIAMYIVSKSEISRKYYGLLIEHGPHWIKFTILAFINEKHIYFKCPSQIWSKFISFDMRKKWEM
jgi:hypothetical protein